MGSSGSWLGAQKERRVEEGPERQNGMGKIMCLQQRSCAREMLATSWYTAGQD